MKIQNETILGSQPKTALARSFPCMLNPLNSSQADLSGMIYAFPDKVKIKTASFNTN
jgi:hypothetical protein